MRRLCIAAAAAAALAPAGQSLGAQQGRDSTAIRQQATIDSLSAAMRALQARLDSLASTPAPAPAPRTSGAYMNVSFVGLTDFAWSSKADLSTLQQGGHEPKARGFSVPNAELALDGAVDPYFKAFTNIVYQLNEKGETNVELEEAYLVTTSLPANLQLKIGQFFPEFGRQNNQHPHAWSFADAPLVGTRFLGADGLRATGARVSWLLPTPFYAEAMVSVMNSAGATTAGFRSDESSTIHGGVPVERTTSGAGDMLYIPRVTASFDLNDTQTLLLGASGAFGPNNSGPTSRTAIYGADLYWKWKSPTANAGFPFVALQSEYIARRYDAAARTAINNSGVLPAETLRDGGAYAQVTWGIKPRIVAGLRAEYVDGDKASFVVPDRQRRTRISPNFTWFPTEFSKFRIQYNHDERRGLGGDHTLLVQFEFLLGAHAAHKF